MNVRSFRRGAGTSLLALALVVSACGSSSKKSSPNSAGSSATVAAAAGSTWTVGTIGDFSGPESSSIGGAKQTMQAWANWTNAHGGVNGHRIKLIVMDDQSNPGTGLAEVKQMVEQDHIIAIVGSSTTNEAAWASYIAQQGIPVVGGLAVDATWLTNADFYPSSSDVLAGVYGPMYVGKQAGKSKFALLYCAESPACAQAAPLYKQVSQSLPGVSVVYTAAVSATAPDYTSSCLAAKSAGADMMEIASDSNTVLRVAQNCANQTYTPLQTTFDGTITQAWLKAPAVNGAVSVQPVFPFVDNSVPASQAFQQALQQYAPGLIGSSLYGPNDAIAWTGGQLFVAAAKAANLGANPTSAQVKQGLYALHDETLGGISPPLTFTSGKPTMVPCFFSMGVKDGKFTEPQGLTVACRPTS